MESSAHVTETRLKRLVCFSSGKTPGAKEKDGEEEGTAVEGGINNLGRIGMAKGQKARKYKSVYIVHGHIQELTCPVW